MTGHGQHGARARSRQRRRPDRSRSRGRDGAADGARGRPEQVELEHHPDTGREIKGIRLPDWPALAALGLQAATAFPGLRLQAWDVALTTRGPVLVEVNIGGDFNLPQLALAAGLMDERFRRFLERCGGGRR